MIQKYKIWDLECIILLRKIPSLNLLPSIKQDRKLRLAQTDKAVLWQSCSTKDKINTVRDQKLEVVIPVGHLLHLLLPTCQPSVQMS